MTVALAGIGPGRQGETRAIAYLKVSHNDTEYDWKWFVPEGTTDLTQFLVDIEDEVKSDIDAKEAQWAALTPKTRTIEDPMGESITVPIEKGEIVKANEVDYYASRRQEYPSIADQLDALWKGGQAQAEMTTKIQAVKSKYPKA